MDGRNCPFGHHACPHLDDANALETFVTGEIEHAAERQYTTPPVKDEHGRCPGCGNTGWMGTRSDQSRTEELEPCYCKRGEAVRIQAAQAMHSVGLPGCRGKRGGIA